MIQVSLSLIGQEGKKEFELDRARRKNNIAENSFALGHKTDNTKLNVKDKTVVVSNIYTTNLINVIKGSKS